MGISIRKLVMTALMAFLVATPPLAQETEATAGLVLDRSLSQRSLEKIADGSAASGRSRLLTPAPGSAPATDFRFLLLGALALAAAGFAAGLFTARRRAAAAAGEAPVALWLDAEALQAELAEREAELLRQQQVIEELTRESEAAQDDDRLGALEAENQALSGELQALRLRADQSSAGEAQDTIDALRAEIERLLGADVDTAPERRGQAVGDAADDALRVRIDQQQTHIESLEELLQSAQAESDAAGDRAADKEKRLQALENDLADRDAELEKLRSELGGLREKAILLDEKEGRVAVLDEELSSLRDEMNELLGKTGQYQVLVPELENKLFHHQEQIGALESDLRATAAEVVERENTAQQWEAQVETLQEQLDAAGGRIGTLESQLTALRHENELLRRDPDAASRESDPAEERLRQAQATMDEANRQRERLEEWHSTLDSLRAEVRRKSTLIDSQSDHLAIQSDQIGELRTEIRDLQRELGARRDESESLRKLLAEAGTVVESLQDEMGEQAHAETRMRYAGDPVQDPFGNHENAVDPIEADIEALRFTARSRRDLGDSLETILREERTAVEQASRRVSERDEELSGLKNEISANRLAMLALQSRLNDVSGDGGAAPSPMQAKKVERELRQSMKVLEALRADLQKWRGRVKPLHEALVARNERIQHLEAEIAALRQAQGLGPEHDRDGAESVVDDVVALLDRAQNGESPEAERSRCLDEMKQQWDRIVSLETELADTGAKLARLLELDEARCRQIESLELARSAQFARIAELRTELAGHGIDDAAEASGNVVDLGARRPS